MHPSTTDDTAADNVQKHSEGWRISNLEASEEASIAEAPEAGGDEAVVEVDISNH